MTYPDAETVVCALLADLAPAVTYRTKETPPPYIFVRRTGGAEDGITDRPVIRVETLHNTRAEAATLMNQVRARILNAGCTKAGGALIDTTAEIQGGQQAPYFNPEDRNVVSSYRFSFRHLPGTPI